MVEYAYSGHYIMNVPDSSRRPQDKKGGKAAFLGSSVCLSFASAFRGVVNEIPRFEEAELANGGRVE